jgi:regulator of protease activity HflC (stomatin/prohibitin superfamily)
MLFKENGDLNLKTVGFAVLAVAVLITALLTYYRVEEYERVVVTRFGKFQEVSGPGLHFRTPFVHGLQTFRVDKQSFTNKGAPANTYTIDNQEVDVVFTVQYTIPPGNVERVYKEAQNYEALILQTAVDRLKSEMGQVNATNVAENRGKLRAKIFDSLQKDAGSLGLMLVDFQLTNIDFTKGYRASVEAAAKEKAAIDQREYERQQAEKTAQKERIVAEGKANAAREEAKGQAEAIEVVAKAEAQAMRLKGNAQAEAMKAQALALSANPVLVEMKKAENWDGKLPVQMLSGVTPFMQFAAPGGGK